MTHFKENTTEGKGLRVMSDIEKIIEGLELIEIVVPSYKHARRKGMSDDEAETVVNWAVEQAIILLEQLRRAMYSKENTAEGGGASESLGKQL